ncbi:hypothetical protein ACFIOZ_07390 [Vreelandella sp. F11]|uniref:hypothetical protein n=1 Tax=Vreelandella sp. F11 TaxID=3394751 RepID=UPI0036DA0285
MCMRDLVARGKPTAHPREQREAVPGLACAGSVGWVPQGVVPPPFVPGCRCRCLRTLAELAFFVTTRYGCTRSISVV